MLSRDTFAADVIMAKSVVSDAEALYARAVGAREAVFTTPQVVRRLFGPYPPGVPAILPGERCNRAVVDYLRAGGRPA